MTRTQGYWGSLDLLGPHLIRTSQCIRPPPPHRPAKGTNDYRYSRGITLYGDFGNHKTKDSPVTFSSGLRVVEPPLNSLPPSPSPSRPPSLSFIMFLLLRAKRVHPKRSPVNFMVPYPEGSIEMFYILFPFLEVLLTIPGFPSGPLMVWRQNYLNLLKPTGAASN